MAGKMVNSSFGLLSKFGASRIVKCYENRHDHQYPTVSSPLKTTYKTTDSVKQVIIILTTLFFLSGCCGLLCERQKHAETIIEKVEAYRQKKGKLPEKVTEVGIDVNQDYLSFYIKQR